MYSRSALVVFTALCGLAVAGGLSRAEDPYDSPRYELMGAEGKMHRFDELRGQFALVAFGFTHCGHICPMMAAKMASVLRQSDVKLAGVFISVDNERDTPDKTDQYAKRFDPRMIGLTGSYEQLSTAARSFGISYVVTKSQNTYTVQHTQHIFLIGPAGGVIETFALNTPTDDILDALRKHKR